MGGCDESILLGFSVLIALLLLGIINLVKIIRMSRRIVIKSTRLVGGAK